jgi:hypothetical protein
LAVVVIVPQVVEMEVKGQDDIQKYTFKHQIRTGIQNPSGVASSGGILFFGTYLPVQIVMSE